MDNKTILATALKLAEKYAPNTNWSAFVDFSRPANQHRFFLINNNDAEITYSWFTSHGKGSGPLEQVDRVSNTVMSLCSSKGRYKTLGLYQGKYGLSLQLNGEEPLLNGNVKKRAIVMHRSNYVSKSYMESHDYPGRSWGCITLEPRDCDDIINKLKGGSLLYVNV